MIKYAVNRSNLGWWVGQLGVDFVDDAVLQASGNESSLFQWDGVVGRFPLESEAIAACEREIADMKSPSGWSHAETGGAE